MLCTNFSAQKLLLVCRRFVINMVLFLVLGIMSTKLNNDNTNSMTYKVKEPVKIRQKKLANGNISLYLAIYVEGQGVMNS